MQAGGGARPQCKEVRALHAVKITLQNEFRIIQGLPAHTTVPCKPTVACVQLVLDSTGWVCTGEHTFDVQTDENNQGRAPAKISEATLALDSACLVSSSRTLLQCYAGTQFRDQTSQSRTRKCTSYKAPFVQDRCTSEHGGSYIQDTECSKARNLSFVPGFTRPCTLYVRLHVDCASVTWGSQRWLQELRDWIAGFGLQ